MFKNAAETTFGMVTGKFDFDSMAMVAPILGPIVFFIFVFCTSIILVNVFLTLIISAFETVKRDVMKQDNEYQIVDFMMKKMKSLLGLYKFPLVLEDEMDEKEKRMKFIEEQIESLPMKIEQLKHCVEKRKAKNQPKVEQQLDKNGQPMVLDVVGLNNSIGNNNQMIPPENVEKRTNRRQNRKSNSKDNSDNQRVTFLDWNEVQD